MPFVPSLSRYKNNQYRRINDRLFKAMERYWAGKAQVAPLTEYLRPERINRERMSTLRIQSPEDLAWMKDPEGFLLGKYDF